MMTDRERVAILRSACGELYGEARMAGDCEALDSGWVCGMLRGALEQTMGSEEGTCHDARVPSERSR